MPTVKRRWGVPSDRPGPILLTRRQRGGGSGGRGGNGPSNVWDHFQPPEDILGESGELSGSKVQAKCVHCGRAVRGNRKVTSNFITHLKTHHPDKFTPDRSRQRVIVPRSAQYDQEASIVVGSSGNIYGSGAHLPPLQQHLPVLEEGEQFDLLSQLNASSEESLEEVDGGADVFNMSLMEAADAYVVVATKDMQYGASKLKCEFELIIRFPSFHLWLSSISSFPGGQIWQVLQKRDFEIGGQFVRDLKSTDVFTVVKLMNYIKQTEWMKSENQKLKQAWVDRLKSGNIGNRKCKCCQRQLIHFGLFFRFCFLIMKKKLRTLSYQRKLIVEINCKLSHHVNIY